MKVEVSRQDDVSVVSLEGSIDGKTAPLVREELQPVLSPARSVILDMSRVEYLSSAGLRLLLLIYREFKTKNGRLVLLGVSPDIQMVMSHTGFLGFFTLAQTKDEALRALR
jgi:anti-sigma B factor antagonist